MKILCSVCIKYTKTPVASELGKVIEFTGSPYQALTHYEKLGHSFSDEMTYVDYVVVEYDLFDEQRQREMFG